MGNTTKSVIFFTANFTVKGEFDTHQQPVLDILNSDGSPHLRLTNAELATVSAEQSCKMLFEATIPKTCITLGAVPSAPYKKAIRNSLLPFTRRDWPVYLLAGPYEITGQLSLRGGPDAVTALKSELSDFFPLTEATIFDFVGGRKWSIEVVFVNKHHINALSIDSDS